MQPSTIPSSTGRVHAIDGARGIAVVLMVATHTTDAFLSEAWRQNNAWYALNILFGFVAPAFALLSGVTLWPALMRRAGSGERRAALPVDLLRRFGILLLLGYWLQTPVLSLRQLVYAHRPDNLARMFDVNILQVIAVTGIMLVLLTHLLRRPEAARIAALVLALTVTAATPYVWSSDLHTLLPLPLGAYAAPTPPATFGLFPCAAYMLFGFAVSATLLRAGAARRNALVLCLAGMALLGSGPLLTALLANTPPHDRFWGGSAQHALFRTGGALLLVALCMMIGRRSDHGPRSRRAQAGAQPAATTATRPGLWLEYIGRRSLSMYVVHLVLVYGSPLTMGMRYWFNNTLNRTLDPLQTAALAAVILAVTAAGLMLWDRIQRRRPAVTRWIALGWWGAFWGFFLLSP